ncbi:TetR/AcrR family transcriptional regulator [Streptomonospora sp. S1-112]|uniref:TetR/AcrR family transcriptional regulator n=1 Tax=Streptomonospora mangrovi TaxID=2883123 RepID=A0A9X3NIY2_9ACTN|nr:TetR/AcrR family transcriptional regulator [Streptomonospora mangrovi]MDA0563920.1 TetR/AcrR family transcriptional regulator [Streptomonospora mangrovi]
MPAVSKPPNGATTRVSAGGGGPSAPRRRPRQQRSRHTVEVLLEAAAQVFDREGLGATTNRIAERAGYSIGTLYQYFPDKRAMLLALAERHLDEVERAATAALAGLRGAEPDPGRAVRTLVESVAAIHRERPGLHRVMYRFTPRSPEAVERLESTCGRVADALAAEFARCGRDHAEAERTAALVVHAADAHLHRIVLANPAEQARVAAALTAIAAPTA